ncbi:class I SAM-dependent methyltransferase [Atopococcus tabaci]|uniref:class I SAM-dependent methyltransferase n=1 Tax=Atopococcus tabaci TaxID=269774 RepID=UPI0004015748|nr:class I SAM-dependent methyltransferase [Atopococcus tabaci]
MSEHYYTKDPKTKSNPVTWETTLDEKTFRFTSDSGVFSKERVDFGSRLMIESVDLSDYPEGDLLDVGCGYGPIGLALAAKDKNRTVEMVDINQRALDLAAGNAALNGITNVKIHPSNLYESVEGCEFAGVFSNPPIRAGKQLVHQILEEASRYLKPDGYLTIVIQKKQGAPSARKKMEEVFGNVERIALEKGYWILQSQKQA